MKKLLFSILSSFARVYRPAQSSWARARARARARNTGRGHITRLVKLDKYDTRFMYTREFSEIIRETDRKSSAPRPTGGGWVGEEQGRGGKVPRGIGDRR